MASPSKEKLNAAIDAVAEAYARLDAAIEVAAAQRAAAAGARESVQAEISAGWEQTTASLETELADAQAENSFLKEDNVRLSNQLKSLQQEYLELQTAANGTLSRLDNSVRQLDLILEH